MKITLLIALLAFASTSFARTLFARNYSTFNQHLKIHHYVDQKHVATTETTLTNSQSLNIEVPDFINRTEVEGIASFDGNAISGYKCYFNWVVGGEVSKADLYLIPQMYPEFICDMIAKD